MLNHVPFKNYQSMNLVYKAQNGHELWLGDYYAAIDFKLLKQKDINSGNYFFDYSSDCSHNAWNKVSNRSANKS
jgi:hypothetical protein